ncbi:hypothetical protein BD770DRAFT_130247 [Pilaira anomala]|nr:hypothetical protein BD770DRAFT_130247 [Pilaira anomala]
MEPGHTVHANALASLANISAQSLNLHVSENYTKILKNYIKIRLKEVFNLTAPYINSLCHFVFNNSINSSTGLAWPETVENTPGNLNLANIIIADCRITNVPVTLTSVSANPGFFLQHMHQMLQYLEAYNNDNIRTFDEVQVDITYAWIKSFLSTSSQFKNFSRKKKNKLSFLVFRCIRDHSLFGTALNLENDQLAFLINFIATTQEQLRNSRLYHENRDNIDIQNCFRPSMSESVRKYKLFTLVPMYNFTRKYVEIDIAHLRSLILKVQNETEVDMGILDENADDNTKHEAATRLFSEVFDFGLLRIDLN